jgi:hypothetical protein
MRGWRIRRAWPLGRRGSVAIQMATLMVVLIGMTGLGSEIPFLMYKQRQLQTVADSTAYSAAVALAKGYPAISTEANAVAAALGFTNGIGKVNVTAANPPTSGNFVRNTDAVEVTVSQLQAAQIGGILGIPAYNLTARAVARRNSGLFCILVLDPSSSTTTQFFGADVTMANCGIAVNSAGQLALKLNISTTLSATAVSVVGGYRIDSTSTANVSSFIKSQTATTDPYASLPMPASTGCDHDGFLVANTGAVTQLQPGRYCNGLTISSGASVQLLSGIYYIKAGQFKLYDSATVVGNGVTIVLTSMDGCNCYATVSFNNPASVTLSAPTTGSTAGILFFGDRKAPSGNFNYLWTNYSASFTGALYFPSQYLKYNGAISGCHQVVAWQFQIQPASVYFDNTCGLAGMLPIGGVTGLVE